MLYPVCFNNLSVSVVLENAYDCGYYNNIAFNVKYSDRVKGLTDKFNTNLTYAGGSQTGRPTSANAMVACGSFVLRTDIPSVNDGDK